VLVPAYRNDVMHPVDLIEDAAIAYGYGNLHAGACADVHGRRAARDRGAFRGCAPRADRTGFHQVLTLC